MTFRRRSQFKQHGRGDGAGDDGVGNGRDAHSQYQAGCSKLTANL